MDEPARAHTPGADLGVGQGKDQPTPVVVMSTGCLFHLPLPQIAQIARDAGFEGLDLVMGSAKIAPGAEVEAAHALCPVRVVHAPFRNWSAWGGHLNAWRAAADLAGGLLGPENGQSVHVTLHPPAGTLRDAIQTRWFSRAVDLPRLLDVAPGVSLSLENLPWAAGGGSLFGKDIFAELVGECLGKGLGLTLDVCHLGVSGRDVLSDLAKVPAGLLQHVHFSDAFGYTEHLPPGQGALPLGPFLAQLGRTGYGGTVSLELDPSQLPDIQPGAPPEDEAAVVRVLAALRLGMVSALADDPPPAWAGRQQDARPPVSAAAFG